MRFVDEAKIYIKSGDGGQGCVSFRREKFVPRGGPDGGDGGKGGDIVTTASRSHRTLLDMKFNQHHTARRGGQGGGNNRTGKNSDDVQIVVPVGTVIRDMETGELLADMTEDGQRAILALGGKGGRGNSRFKTSTNQAPRYAQDGLPGEEKTVSLELKLIADVGTVGFPNVGKSTLIAHVSAARPKIADYPFTTLKPNLGVVRLGDYKTFVIADIPGLIEGAHLGAGLGTKFLRHIERTSILLHIIDISKDPFTGAWEDFEAINNELASFSPAVRAKPQIVAINKIDLTITRERLPEQVGIFEEKGLCVFPFSAVTGEGVGELMQEVGKRLSDYSGPRA
ncbi:MAG: GTPase ObgE [Deltaproteobacteria bacterium]|nr:GTPase ObgE [Deltaproteobacteria bacterium]MBW2672697.1 GTPase ObgE [Deltaproteobacteria bacterium]